MEPIYNKTGLALGLLGISLILAACMPDPNLEVIVNDYSSIKIKNIDPEKASQHGVSTIDFGMIDQRIFKDVQLGVQIFDREYGIDESDLTVNIYALNDCSDKLGFVESSKIDFEINVGVANIANNEYLELIDSAITETTIHELIHLYEQGEKSNKFDFDQGDKTVYFGLDKDNKPEIVFNKNGDLLLYYGNDSPHLENIRDNKSEYKWSKILDEVHAELKATYYLSCWFGEEKINPDYLSYYEDQVRVINDLFIKYKLSSSYDGTMQVLDRVVKSTKSISELLSGLEIPNSLLFMDEFIDAIEPFSIPVE